MDFTDVELGGGRIGVFRVELEEVSELGDGEVELAAVLVADAVGEEDRGRRGLRGARRRTTTGGHGGRSGGSLENLDGVVQIAQLLEDLVERGVEVGDGIADFSHVVVGVVHLGRQAGDGRHPGIQFALQGLVDRGGEDANRSIGFDGRVERLGDESLNGGQFLILAALQRLHLRLQLGDIALQFHDLFAGPERRVNRCRASKEK